MPSANPSKLEKQASTEANEPIRQAITVIEHKIRNLEKRKGKLESYRDIQKAGKELDRDQKVAVAKYDEVLQTLEITRELYKQIVGIANDAAKQQKKLARKEALERTQQDISKVREVLLIQDTLIHMAGESIRESFLTGTNGAKKLSEEDVKALDDLYNEVTPKRIPESGEAPFQQQLQKAAEHLVAVIDGKSRDVVGTTYAKIKTIVQTINQSEYFEYVSAAQEREESVETKTEESTERVSDAPVQCPGEFSAPEASSIPQDENIPETSYQAPPIVALSGPLPPTIIPQGISSTPGDAGAYYQNSTYVSIQPQPQQTQQQQQPQPPRINDVIGGTPNFFFLQESELDSPDVTNQQQIVSHIPPPVNPAAIPTQTYTNQNFTAVPVQVSPQQVIYAHPPQDLSHIPGFANPNPPPPIPMPPSHQNNMQFSPQHPGDYPSQQAYDQQDPQPQGTEEQVENRPEESGAAEVEQNDSSDWAQMTDSNQIDEWVNTDVQSSGVQEHGQSQQQSWEQRTGGYRGRGGRRGNSNGYNGRGRGGGNYQQNGRGGQGSYYRNENSNYQNGGYQQRNYNNDGSNNGGYNGGGFKRDRDRGNGSGGGGGGNGGPRGGPRNNGGERTGMDRGGRGGSGGGGGGQYRGQRGGNRGGNSSGGSYIPRSKPQAQQ